MVPWECRNTQANRSDATAAAAGARLPDGTHWGWLSTSKLKLLLLPLLLYLLLPSGTYASHLARESGGEPCEALYHFTLLQ